MTIFTGVEQQDGSILWEEDNQSTFQYNQQTNSYDFSTSSIGFINCDAFVADPMNCGTDTDVPADGIGNESCYTDVTFTCPNGFDSGSMQVWIYFDNLSSLLGVPYNIGSYSLMTYMFCKVLSNRTDQVYKPDKLIMSLGDCHIYENTDVGIYMYKFFVFFIVYLVSKRYLKIAVYTKCLFLGNWSELFFFLLKIGSVILPFVKVSPPCSKPFEKIEGFFVLRAQLETFLFLLVK